MSGWRSVDEYVRYFVPRIGYRATAAALNTDVAKLRASYPDIEATNTRGVDVTHDYATSAAAIAKRRARNKAKFANVTVRCARCGKEMVRRASGHKYCEGCAKVVRVHNAAAARERFEARRADSSPDAGETE